VETLPLKPVIKKAQPSLDEAKADATAQAQPKNHFNATFRPNKEWWILLALALLALIPRILLATQLDLVTDEVIYILGGKADIRLLLHLSITSDAWKFNYEHPPVVKLLIGAAIFLNAHLASPLGELFVARLPSIASGTILILAIYWLGREPFGRVVALLAALTLAVSPWLVYFSALAYLDMTMSMLITLAYLVLWYALHRPRLYLLSAVLVGLACASKYTAALAIPSMMLFIVYYFVAIRPRLPEEEKPPVPWRWWLGALLLIPVTFFMADPAIWRDPYNLLLQSVLFEWHHSINGHLTFIAGRYSEHVPHWVELYILFAKLSAFITLPALFFTLFAFIQVGRFHLHRSKASLTEITGHAFLLIWLIAIISMFSLLNIVVGTHYQLPLAPPVALAGASGLTILVRYRRGALLRPSSAPLLDTTANEAVPGKLPGLRVNRRAALVCTLLALLVVVPHTIGLTTVYAAEGYTSEIFQSENTVLQVAYPAYREASLWLIDHTRSSGTVGLVALPRTLTHTSFYNSWLGVNYSAWLDYNHDLDGRLQFSEAHPDARNLPFNYLIWPMHLVQRGYTFPAAWQGHIVHTIMGGNTVYCYILAKNLATITDSGRNELRPYVEQS
jgi:dolichyl-phosphate-mannose-protein mannosyltransferase